MRIGIFGSCSSGDAVEPFTNQSEFDRVCTELGRELSREGHTVLVESDRERTADVSIVGGVRDLEPGDRGAVEAWYRTKPKAGDVASRREPFSK